MVKRSERIEKKKISKGRKPKDDKGSAPKQLLITPDEFNRQVISWLIWYNAERHHWTGT
jgi:hypothetical protein